MYLSYWGLHSPPFVNAPNGNLLFFSPQHEEALNRMKYVLQYRRGVVMISGEVGCGKTTLVRALRNHLPDGRYQVHLISNPALSPIDLIRAVLMQLGGNGDSESKVILLDRIQKILKERAEQQVVTVLAIDEAHVIAENETLDELRMLLNIQSEDEFLITIVLLGQPPLLARISQLHPLNERVGMRIRIEPFDPLNSGRYILFRMRQAGAASGIFSREAVQEIHGISGGIPLRINNICDRSLLVGMMERSRMVTRRIVKAALADLG